MLHSIEFHLTVMQYNQAVSAIPKFWRRLFNVKKALFCEPVINKAQLTKWNFIAQIVVTNSAGQTDGVKTCSLIQRLGNAFRVCLTVWLDVSNSVNQFLEYNTKLS